MQEDKYREIAKSLLSKLEEHTYVVISNSMCPFIKKDDKIVCLKKEISDIKKYNIIAFHNKHNLEVPLVHRIIKIINKNNKTFFQTKGDNSLSADKELIEYNQIIGVVTKIIKKDSVIDLNKFQYKLYSLFIYFISVIVNLFKLCFLKTKNFFLKEQKVEIGENLVVLRQSILTKISDWEDIREQNISLLSEIINENSKICDVSFGGGYCEESFHFIRKKFNIDYKSVNENTDRKYDVIICSRVINIVESYKKRQEIYKYLVSILNDNGKILISYINQKNNIFLKLKRKFYKMIIKNYDGPLYDDITYDKFFVMKQVTSNRIYNELTDNNIKVAIKKEHNNAVTFICTK